MYRNILALLVALLPAIGHTHSLAPATQTAVSVDGWTQVTMKATNHFDKPARFEVLVYADPEGQHPITGSKVAPQKFVLGPDRRRTFRVKVPTTGDRFWICTRRVPAARSIKVMPTEICSKVTIGRKLRSKP